MEYNGVYHNGNTGNGLYEYYRGERIQFRIGDILLGSITAAENITPLDFDRPGQNLQFPYIPSDKAINIMRFLMTLDGDAYSDPDFGVIVNSDIDIDQETRDLSIGLSLDFDISTQAFEQIAELAMVLQQLTTHFSNGVRMLVSEDAATDYFTKLTELTTNYSQYQLHADTLSYVYFDAALNWVVTISFQAHIHSIENSDFI